MNKRQISLFAVFLTAACLTTTSYSMSRFSRYVRVAAHTARTFTANNSRRLLVGVGLGGTIATAKFAKCAATEENHALTKQCTDQQLIDEQAADLIHTGRLTSEVIESLQNKGEVDIKIVESLGRQLPGIIQEKLSTNNGPGYTVEHCLAALGAIKNGSPEGEALVRSIIAKNADLILQYIERFYVADYTRANSNYEKHDRYNLLATVRRVTFKINGYNSEPYLHFATLKLCPFIDILDEAAARTSRVAKFWSRGKSLENLKRSELLAHTLTHMRLDQCREYSCEWESSPANVKSKHYFLKGEYKNDYEFPCLDERTIRLVNKEQNNK